MACSVPARSPRTTLSQLTSRAVLKETVRTHVRRKRRIKFGILSCYPVLMICPHCQSPRIRNLNRTTDLGYALFRCRDCGRKSNERTGTPFNFLELPTDIVFEIVLCRLRYKLSLRNLAEMFLLRGFEFTHEAVREWEERFAPLLAEHMRRKRKGSRAIDREGNLVDSMLSATRDMGAAQRFFRSAQSMVNSAPTQVTTDGHVVSTRDPRNAGSESKTSLQRLREPPNRAGSPGNQATILSDAGLWSIVVSPALLSGVRGSSAVLSPTPQTEGSCPTRPGQATVSVASRRIGIAVPGCINDNCHQSVAPTNLAMPPVPTVLVWWPGALEQHGLLVRMIATTFSETVARGKLV